MAEAGSQLRNWFVDEISSFVPSWFGAMFLGVPVAKRLTFGPGNEVVAGASGGLVAPETWLGSLPPALSLRFRETVDAELPVSCFLTRRIEVPEAAARAFHKAAELDLIRRTPFRPSEVFWSLTPSMRENGRVSATQWIARRSDIETLRLRLQSAGLTLRRVSVEGHPDIGAVADFSGTNISSGRRLRLLNGSLAFAALALAGALWLSPVWSARSELARVSGELPALREEAVRLRSEVEALLARESERGAFLDTVVFRPRLVDLLHDLSVALPDKAWLSELDFHPEGVTLAGETSGSAAVLVLSLSGAGTFENPRLSGAVSRTPQGSERFALAFDFGAPR